MGFLLSGAETISTKIVGTAGPTVNEHL